MSPRVSVIINERARHLGRGSSLRRTILDAAAGADVHVSSDLGALDAIARGIASRGASAVVLAAGDGGFMAGTTALYNAFDGAPPPIALCPGGTVATIARNWGFSGSMDAYARKLVRAVVHGGARATPRASLLVREGVARRVGFIFGTGLVANFFEVYEAAPAKGYAAAARIVASIFAGSFTGGALASRVLDPTPMCITVDGEEQAPRAFSLVAASVVRDLGLHMQLTYRASEDPTRVHVVASALAPSSLGPQMPLVLAGKKLRGEHHVDALAREVTVRFTGERRSYVLDGDLFEAPEVSVGAGPMLSILGL